MRCNAIRRCFNCKYNFSQKHKTFITFYIYVHESKLIFTDVKKKQDTEIHGETDRDAVRLREDNVELEFQLLFLIRYRHFFKCVNLVRILVSKK